jgi:hypothetical protein
VWAARLLSTSRNARGSAPVDTVFALSILLFLVLGVVEVAFALYGRNVVAASAHEGARVAVELGRDPASAVAIARRSVIRSAGGLVEGLQVGVEVQASPSGEQVRVRVTGRLRPFGPVPLPLPVDAVATSSRHLAPR